MPRSLFPRFILALTTALLRAAEPSPIELPADHAERMTRGLETFRTDVRPVLVQQCLKCHGSEKTKGGLDLSNRDDLLKGGDDGPVVKPFHSSDSRLLRLVRQQEDPHMPKEGPPLTAQAVAALAAWIDAGAPYDTPLVVGKGSKLGRSMVTAADRQWWAFQPLSRQPAPAYPGTPNPVDRFLLAKAAPRRLAPPADRRTLLRRASLDLLGMPPTPDEIERFLNDPAPDAWARWVDRLLDSPRYGERWARHWLDVARFAESSGFEHDYDREGAFQFRDFVIRALNQDLPFDDFIRWQIAGDEFDPENPLALMATGFLGAGVFPTQITANEVERTRYDALDDMLSTTANAFLGLTVGCARCHDHKYDPIPSEDYYRMLSTFTTTVRSVLDIDIDPALTRERLRKWEISQAALERDQEAYEGTLREEFGSWLASGAANDVGRPWIVFDVTNTASKAGATFKRLDDGSLLAEGNNGDEDVYMLSGPAPAARLTGIKLDALADPSMKHGGPGRADNGNIGLSRIRVFLDLPGAPRVELALRRATADFEQNGDNLSISSALDERPDTGWAVDPQFGTDHSAVFELAEPVKPVGGGTLLVQLEFQLNTRHNIGRPRLSLTSDPEPSLKADVLPGRIAALLRNARAPGWAASVAAEEKAALFDWWKRQDPGWKKLRDKRVANAAKKPDGRTKVLVCAEGYPALRMHTQGADFFDKTYYLKRGNCELKAGVAPQGFLQVLTPEGQAGARWRWSPPEGARYSGRRRSLANWLTDSDAGAGALVARVAVNRVWQHHFGVGIVSTPNDFGKTGSAPSHPELLDWLARELIRSGWRLKPIHRLLMTSQAYQQGFTPDASTADGINPDALFLRRTPRRLEGEAIRDSILFVAGALDSSMFGPGSKDERNRRRSVYFKIKRSELIGSMVAFDQPEPLTSQGFRPTTTVAPQALLLLNGQPVREWSEAFSRRVSQGNPALPPAAAVSRAYQWALGRQPTNDETRDATAFLDHESASYRAEGKPDPFERALTDFCQVLFGLNEFAYAP